MTPFYYILIVALFVIIIIPSNKHKKKSSIKRKPSLKKDKKQAIKTPTKNKWLYPSDEFGKLEEGVVFDSKTYKRPSTKDSLQVEVFNIN
jgi:hypothetical protein